MEAVKLFSGDLPHSRIFVLKASNIYITPLCKQGLRFRTDCFTGKEFNSAYF